MKRLRSKNRAKGPRGPVFPFQLALALALVATMAWVYLWLRGRCDSLGQEIKRKERALEDLRRRVVNEEFKWANLTSPQNMQRLLQVHRLAMTWPTERDVVRLGEPPLPGRGMVAQARGPVRHE